MGVKVNRTWNEHGKLYNCFTYACEQIDYYNKNILLMLLSVGTDPLNSAVPMELRPQIQSWLSELETAKQCLTAIFDDAMLEKEIADFVFNEAFLKKALDQCE